ncbi:hypothetical protein [Paucilactobacillus kaifaensis]|uniref:hypothetical protein n=1 Tax=Paucilactobacillus kaifaensis TaxID=2559921 RepID=UPI0010F96441|nr:hypothetical protein [Paucilactobacillus kaifaensis]
MGFFSRLFGKDNVNEVVNSTTSSNDSQIVNSDKWLNLDKFIQLQNQRDNRIVSILSTAIAAGDNKKSEFSIKNIKVLNPEFKLVSLLATSIATGDNPSSSFVIKSIKKKID